MTVWGVLAVILVLAGMLYFTRKAGKDVERADTAEANLAKAQEAAKPVTDSERADAIKLYERDGR